VYSRPDSVSGRGGATHPSAVSSVAEELGIPIHSPATLRDADTVLELRDLCADVIVVAAYGLILPVDVLTAAPLGAVNVHASLLPRWRGAAPIQRAILSGDERAGVSIMRMEEGLDTGPYCLQASVDVGTATAEELTVTLADLGAGLLIEALRLVESGAAAWVVQDDSAVTYAEKIRKPDVAVDPGGSAIDIVRRVRASSSAAPSRVSITGRSLTLIRAAVGVSDESLEPGSVVLGRDAVVLGATDGSVLVTRLKPDGKTEMDATAWARGVRDIEASTWKALS